MTKMHAPLQALDGAPTKGPGPDQIADAFRVALAQAERHVGATAPNPAVGCALLDARGEILAAAGHARAGQAHAEAAAIRLCREAGLTERLHTAVVTLEPCSHAGRTPPCVDALLATPVRQVWIGSLDPHPRAPGRGVGLLKGAGVDVGMIGDLDHPAASELARSAERLIAPFATQALTGRPWVIVKTALDAGGGMIPPPGRKTFTSAASLTYAHRLRRGCEAIVTGSGCVLADDPHFTVRHVPDHADVRRRLVILDRRGRTPPSYLREAAIRGLDPVVRGDIGAALDELGAAGVLTALVEAGPTLRAAILDLGLWDEEITLRQAATPGEPDTVDVRFKGGAEKVLENA